MGFKENKTFVENTPDDKIPTNEDDLVTDASSDATLKNDHEQAHLMTFLVSIN